MCVCVFLCVFGSGAHDVGLFIHRDWAFARMSTIDAGVTVIPPSAFVTDASKPLWANYARFAFCKQDISITTACERLQAFREKQQA